MTAELPERFLKISFGAVPFFCGQKSTKGSGNMVESGEGMRKETKAAGTGDN